MYTTTPVGHVDISPENHTLGAGSGSDPTDAERVIEAPADSWLAALLIDVDAEVGLRVHRRGGARIFPESAPAEGSFLYRANWPDSVPIGRAVGEGDELTVEWRNRGGAEVAVDGVATFAARGRR